MLRDPIRENFLNYTLKEIFIKEFLFAVKCDKKMGNINAFIAGNYWIKYKNQIKA